MNIAIVSDAIYPYNKGGKEKRIFEISTRLAKKGHKVTIYCMKWWKGKDNKKENGVFLNAISSLYPLYVGRRRSIKQAIIFALSCFKLINKDFDVIDIDHMPHLVLFPLKIICILRRKKMIVTWNEVWGKEYWIEYMGIMGNMAYIIEKFGVLMPDKIISISKHTTNKLKNDLSSKKEIITIPMGINLFEISKIKPSSIRSDIIFAGRLLRHKNVNILIDAIKIVGRNIPNIKCLIIGEGPEKENLIRQVQRLGLKKNIKFLNFLFTHNNLYSLIKSSKVFVLPSTREGFGIVVLEANACGIPAITIDNNNNAAKDLIEAGRNGFITDLNEKSLSTTILKTMRIGKKMKKSCLNEAKKHDWSNISNELEEVYR